MSTKIVALYLFLACGFIFAKTGIFTERHSVFLNKIVISVFIPALTIYHLPRINVQLDTIWLSATPFLIFFSAILYVKLISLIKSDSIPRTTEGALVMTSGIGTISFVGFPVIEALYGEIGLSYAIVTSISGTFLLLNTVGIFTALNYSYGKFNPMGFMLKVIKYPPFLAFIFAIIYFGFGATLPTKIETGLGFLSALFPAVALITLGAQLRFDRESMDIGLLAFGLFFKLMLAPLLVYIFFWYLVDTDPLIAKVCVLLAGVGSMHAASVMAIELGLDPKISKLMPSITVPLSIPLIVLWSSFL